MFNAMTGVKWSSLQSTFQHAKNSADLSSAGDEGLQTVAQLMKFADISDYL